MSNDPQSNGDCDRSNARFKTTRWSVVLGAKENSPAGTKAFEELFAAYWAPIYAFIRRNGHASHDAEDLTQGFILHILERRTFDNAAQEKGRFRSFIIGCLKNYLANERRRGNAEVRGGRLTFLSLDVASEEEALRVEVGTSETPETLYEKRWATLLLEKALGKLREEYVATGRSAQFERLNQYLQDPALHGGYRQPAVDLKMSEGAVTTAVFRLRKSFRELFRAEVAETVASMDEIEDEMRHLISVYRQTRNSSN